MASLPIDEVLPALRAQLASHRSVVLQAPPGAGKTTGVPLALLGEPWLAGGSIIILEPRRLAARAAAMRMSQLRDEAVGETVGYRIRFDSKVSARTRIEVLTEGILTRRLQTDPELSGVGLVIFDEFHERHLHADLALALCLDSQRGLRENLKILVMSATLDGAAISGLLGDAPIVTSAGRSYPVDIRYLPRDPQGPLPPIVAEAVVRALGESEGDVLAFLPGAWEIRRTQELLQPRLGGASDILPLYGDLPWDAQDRAIRSASPHRRVVLATPIAETSLTIEGVRVVVDAGFARVPQYDPGTGLSRLTTVRVSRASADQRAGRAGRTAPGVCYRLWGESTQRGLVPQSLPEIRTADLAPLTLELAAWGVGDANALSWLDPPPAPALDQARALLIELDALDADGRITDAGRNMVALPVHPRLAHMLRAARMLRHGSLACDIAALLSERDVLTANARRSADFAARLEALWAFYGHGRAGAQDHDADPIACQRVAQAANQYRRLLGLPAQSLPGDTGQSGLLLALAYPDRVALARNRESGRYQLASGRGARLREDEMRLRAPCIVAASLDARDEEGLIYLAAPLEEEQLRRHFAGHLRLEDSVRWDSQQQLVVTRREERFGALVLQSKPLPRPDSEQVRAAMQEGVRRLGIDALPWTPELRQWQARVRCLREWCPEEGLPDVSDVALLGSMEQWLAPFLDGVSRRDHLARVDLPAALHGVLNWKQSRRLDEGAPTHLEVPSGSRIRLEYAPGQSPVLAVKLQEMFGSADTPRIAWGRVPVTLHLLSPARRPIQVTQDLRGFWDRTYAEVKKELKGRYPKHPWPDDPWNAPPTRRTR